MKSLLKVYQNDTCDLEGSSFMDVEGNKWSAPYLYEQVEKLKLKQEKVCLRHLNLYSLPWNNGSIGSMDNFIYHSVRVQNADTTIPIIIGWDGFVMDGWHRIAKAVLEDKKSIQAYRFESPVDPEQSCK